MASCLTDLSKCFADENKYTELDGDDTTTNTNNNNSNQISATPVVVEDIIDFRTLYHLNSLIKDIQSSLTSSDILFPSNIKSSHNTHKSLTELQTLRKISITSPHKLNLSVLASGYDINFNSLSSNWIYNMELKFMYSAKLFPIKTSDNILNKFNNNKNAKIWRLKKLNQIENIFINQQYYSKEMTSSNAISVLCFNEFGALNTKPINIWLKQNVNQIYNKKNKKKYKKNKNKNKLSYLLPKPPNNCAYINDVAWISKYNVRKGYIKYGAIAYFSSSEILLGIYVCAYNEYYTNPDIMKKNGNMNGDRSGNMSGGGNISGVNGNISGSRGNMSGDMNSNMSGSNGNMNGINGNKSGMSGNRSGNSGNMSGGMINNDDWKHAQWIFKTSLFVSSQLRSLFLSTYFIKSSSWIISIREYLPNNHPIRCLSEIFNIGTCASYSDAFYEFFNENGLFNRVFSFEYSELIKLFNDLIGDYKYETITDKIRDVYNSYKDDNRQNLSIYRDINDFWEITYKFVAQYINIYYGVDKQLIQDVDINSFWCHLLNKLNLDSTSFSNKRTELIEILTDLICNATIISQIYSSNIKYFLQPNFIGLRIRMPSFQQQQYENDIIGYIQSLIYVLRIKYYKISQKTKLKLLNNWTHLLLNDKYKNNTKNICLKYQNDLKILTNKIRKRNKKRKIPFISCHPQVLTTSILI